MCAMLIAVCLLFTRPMYSSMRLGLLPAASTVVGFDTSVGIAESLMRDGFGVKHPIEIAVVVPEHLDVGTSAVDVEGDQRGVLRAHLDAPPRPAAVLRDRREQVGLKRS